MHSHGQGLDRLFLDEIMAQRDEWRQQRDQIAEDRDSITQDRDDLLDSTIWKATKPVRWVIRIFKG